MARCLDRVRLTSTLKALRRRRGVSIVRQVCVPVECALIATRLHKRHAMRRTPSLRLQLRRVLLHRATQWHTHATTTTKSPEHATQVDCECRVTGEAELGVYVRRSE